MANEWGWPFSGGYNGYEEGQQFGMTSFERPPGSGLYFHDGFDFGSAKYPGSQIKAIHAGTVVYANFAPVGYEALGTVIVIKTTGGYNIVYQEFGTSTSNINVTVGQSVTLGQVIGTRNSSHLHLGITKKDWLEAQSSAYTDDGTWLNPITIIQNGDGNPNPDLEEEEMIYAYSADGESATFLFDGINTIVFAGPKAQAAYNHYVGTYEEIKGKKLPNQHKNAAQHALWIQQYPLKFINFK